MKHALMYTGTRSIYKDIYMILYTAYLLHLDAFMEQMEKPSQSYRF